METMLDISGRLLTLRRINVAKKEVYKIPYNTDTVYLIELLLSSGYVSEMSFGLDWVKEVLDEANCFYNCVYN